MNLVKTRQYFVKKSISVGVVSLAAVLMGCSEINVRGGGAVGDEAQRYSTFFTPTHQFQCELGLITVHIVPGDRYGAGDVSNFPYFEGWGGATKGNLRNSTVALRLATHELISHEFFVIDPKGNFIRQEYPVAVSFGEAVTFGTRDWQCTNKGGMPPFKQVIT